MTTMGNAAGFLVGTGPHLLTVFGLLAVAVIYCLRCRTPDSYLMVGAQLLILAVSLGRLVLMVLTGFGGGSVRFTVVRVGYLALGGVGFLAQAAFIVGLAMLVLRQTPYVSGVKPAET